MILDKYDTIIFDYDGTLLDSMPMWYGFASYYVKSKGKTPDKNLDEEVKYLSNYDTAVILNSRYHLFDTVEEMLDDLNSFVEIAYERVELKKGAKELLDKLKEKKKKIYILSATPYELLKLSMEHCGIIDYFDHIYSSSDLRLSKEDGSAFRYVFYELHVTNENAVIVEDSVLAMRACVKNNINILIVNDFSNQVAIEEINKTVKKAYNINELF